MTLMNHEEKEKHVFSSELSRGLEILRNSKTATVLLTNGSDSDVVNAEFQRLLNSFSELMKVHIFHGCVLQFFLYGIEYISMATKICTFSMVSFECSHL